MVVTPDPPRSRDNGEHVTYDEERTYREAIKTLRMAEHDVYEGRIQLLNEKIDGLADKIAVRFDAMDKAAVLLADCLNQVPSTLDREVNRLTQLFDEKLIRVDSISKEQTAFVRTIAEKLTISADADVLGARVEAQTANNALQVLLEASMASGVKLADVRFDAQEIAITKTENAITTAMTSAQAAITAAHNSASAALLEVDSKSELRHVRSLSAVSATEDKLTEKIVSLQKLIDLRAAMTEDAVSKANDANEKRFESVNEFRGQQTDLIRQFVTVPVLDARMSQLTVQTETLDRQLRIDTSALRDMVNQLSTRMTSKEASDNTKQQVHTNNNQSTASIVGIIGGAVGVLGLVATLLFNTMGNKSPPNVGADTKRVDDLISQQLEQNRALNSRLDSLSARMTATGRTP